METIIHNAIYESITSDPPRRIDGMLWASDLGKNPYFVAKRLLARQLDPFDYPTQIKMSNGNALEEITLEQIAQNTARPMWTQFPVYNELWTGYADVVLGHGSDLVDICDIKATSDKWWDYKGTLPRTGHVLQVWKYGQLYEAMYGVKPRLRLYYRGWGCWAEFEIKAGAAGLACMGHVTDDKGLSTGNEETRLRYVDPHFLEAELERVASYVNGFKRPVDFERAMAALKRDLGIYEPDGPDWDYAERRTDDMRLKAEAEAAPADKETGAVADAL